MNSRWLMVLIAALFEVLWVIGLTHAYDFWTWAGTAFSIAVSFYLLILSGKYLPVGTAYAVFVGLGTAGTVMSEIIFFSSPWHWNKIALIVLLLIGVIGLKTVSDSSPSKTAK